MNLMQQIEKQRLEKRKRLRVAGISIVGLALFFILFGYFTDYPALSSDQREGCYMMSVVFFMMGGVCFSGN